MLADASSGVDWYFNGLLKLEAEGGAALARSRKSQVEGRKPPA